MSVCDNFTQHAWRPDVCSTCQKNRSDHNSLAPEARSWRRRSEPNPNNAITGVRISALASKFQTPFSEHGATAKGEAERARTLDRKALRNKEKRLSISRSTELLDSAEPPSSSSSVSVARQSDLHTVSSSTRFKESRRNQTNGVHEESVKPSSTVSGAVLGLNSTAQKQIPASSSSSSNQGTCKSLVTITENQSSGPPLASDCLEDSAQTTTCHSSLSSTGSSPRRNISLRASPASNIKSNSHVQSGKLVSRTTKNQSPLTKSLTNPPLSSTTKSKTQSPSQITKPASLTHPNLQRKQPTSSNQNKTSEKRRVSIPDQDPEVIGHDGGLDNLYPQEDELAVDDDNNLYFPLTDEEKEFALLALGNTLWNADTKNLQVDQDVTSRACREFEDLDISELWSRNRFKSLVNCDLLKSCKSFGTFPQKSTTKQSKVSVGDICFPANGIKSGEPKGICTTSIKPIREHTESCVKINQEIQEEINLSSVSVLTVKANIRDQSSKCEAVDLEYKERRNSDTSNKRSAPYSVNDLTDSPHDISDKFPTSEENISGTSKNGTLKHTTPLLDEVPNSILENITLTRLELLSAMKKQNVGIFSEGDARQVNSVSAVAQEYDHGLKDVREAASFGGIAQEEVQAMALLNNMLKEYGDQSQKSTGDISMKDTQPESFKDNNISDFKAKQASVAATLDLNKQQQRARRMAPRPPVSPPPEPSLSEAVSPRKVLNQPDPVFRMVTMGKSIVTPPPQMEMALKSTKPQLISYGLEDFTSLQETSGETSTKANNDGKSKKGITSFLRNILRRGKELSENVEYLSSEVQLSKKETRINQLQPQDVKASSLIPHVEESNGDSQVKDPVISCTIPDREVISNNAEDITQHSSEGTAAIVDANMSSEINSRTSIAQPEINKKLESPKQALKMATGKQSPTVKHRSTHQLGKEPSVSMLTTSKPYPAPKPGSSIVDKPQHNSDSDSSSHKESVVARDVDSSGGGKEPACVPHVVRHRHKSPKRTAPPIPPARHSAGSGKAAAAELITVEPSQESGLRLRRSSSERSGGAGTLSRSETQESIRRSMPTPPSPPGDKKDNSDSNETQASVSPSASLARASPPSSPSSPTLADFHHPSTEITGVLSRTSDDEPRKLSEKIELPTVATQSRKGFLGKLGGNRKSRAPQPPSVKRTKSTTQSSTLPRGDKKSKKINLADISAPVMVTDVTNVKIANNRRNTISLGDEPGLISISTLSLHSGSMNSSGSLEKGGLDEFDVPNLSPLGSLGNLYDSVLSKPGETLFHFYDPPTSPKILCPNIPSDGYLEPIRPLSQQKTATLLSSVSTTSLVAATPSPSLSSSSSSSLSSVTTNVSAVQAPSLKSESPKMDKSTLLQRTNSKGSSASSLQFQHNNLEESRVKITDDASDSSPNLNEVSRDFDDVTSNICNNETSPALSVTTNSSDFIEPEMTEERRILLLSQPIYEEIPSDDDDGHGINRFQTKEQNITTKASVEPQRNIKSHVFQEDILGLQAVHAAAALDTCKISSTIATVVSLPSSPLHALSKPGLTSSSLTVSVSSLSSIPTPATAMASSKPWNMPPPPPPPTNISSSGHSVSRETISSESDSHSSCSNEGLSANGTLPRPKPVPRQKPRRHGHTGSDQYVSLIRRESQVSLSEEKMRDAFSKLTHITFRALQEIYSQCEKNVTLDRLHLPEPTLLKWADFDIYGKPLHSSERCIVYSATLRSSHCHCQLLILHSRPALETSDTAHLSLLRPAAVFADSIPTSVLTADFIQAGKLLQNTNSELNIARCFVAVGTFDIVESLDSHLAFLRETLAQDLNSYLNVKLMALLQLLSAFSYCLDQGFSVTEAEYEDIFLITRSDLKGKVVAFLPCRRSQDVLQGEAMCNLLDHLLVDRGLTNSDEEADLDEEMTFREESVHRMILPPRKSVSKLRSLLQPRRLECLAQVRSAVEYLLWGPVMPDVSKPPADSSSQQPAQTGTASKEQELYIWLEQERATTVGRLASGLPGPGLTVSLEDFYLLKFLLKTSAGSLVETLKQLYR